MVAITVKLWADPETDGAKACCSPEAVLGARALAHSLGIPHFTLDLEEDFRRRVVGRFIDGYAAGSTPNPCILCNGEVRLAAMVDLAERLGADAPRSPATTRGSSRTARARCSPPPPTRPRTRATCSPRCRRELLGRLRFPLTELTKPEVREIAARHGLAVAKKPESQDLCFLAGQGKRGFLRRHGGLRERDGRGRRPRRPRRSAATAATTTSPSASAAGSASRRRSRSTCSPPTPPPTRSRSAPATSWRRARVQRPRRRPAPRRRPRRRGPAALPLARAARPRSAAPAPGRHAALEVELGEAFAGASPGQTAVLLAGEAIVGHGTIAAAA